MLRRLFYRLDTTPGQEKVLGGAADAFQDAFYKLRDELRTARGDVARALRAEHFDAAAVREGFARQDAVLEELRKTGVEHLQAIHEALQPEQRRELADLLEGAGRHGCGGGYRGHGHRFAHADGTQV